LSDHGRSHKSLNHDGTDVHRRLHRDVNLRHSGHSQATPQDQDETRNAIIGNVATTLVTGLAT